jgi:hypothetical protein
MIILKSVYIGGPDVTTSNGLRLLKQDSLEITLHQANQIYAVSSQNQVILFRGLRRDSNAIFHNR